MQPQGSMAGILAQPLMQERSSNNARVGKVLALSLLIGLGCVVLWNQVPHTSQGVVDPTIDTMALAPMQVSMQPFKAKIANAEGKALGAAATFLRGETPSGRRAIQAQAFAGAMQFAARQGAQAGCRGQLTCVRAVGVFYGTQTGKTEEVADLIAQAAGVSPTDIGEASAADLAGYDGLIVGAPTWHTGADEQRSGTTWDDYLEEIKGLDLCGKPVAVFGSGDSVGYGDNFCDAIEELHATFEAAGAKMLGYTPSSGYEFYTESKSVKGDKFLGLPLDQDNEDDKTEGRVKTWVEQLKSEGMPLV